MVSINGAIVDFGRQLRPTGAFVAKRLWKLLRTWMARHRERQALGELDDRLLRDIGIDRMAAQFEADRPFWEGRERRRWS